MFDDKAILEYQRRVEALRLAVGNPVDHSANDIVMRAETYFAFLSGTTTAA